MLLDIHDNIHHFFPLPLGFPARLSDSCSRSSSWMRMRLRTEAASTPRQNIGRRFLPKLWSPRPSNVDGHQLPLQEEAPPQQGLSAASAVLNNLIKTHKFNSLSWRRKKNILMILFQ